MENLGVMGVMLLAVVPGQWVVVCPCVALFGGSGGACFFGTLVTRLIFLSWGAACPCCSVMTLPGGHGSSSTESGPCPVASPPSVCGCRCVVGGIPSGVLRGCAVGGSCCGGGVSARVTVGVLLALLFCVVGAPGCCGSSLSL